MSEITFKRTDLSNPKERMKLAKALFNLHLERRELRESKKVNYDILNNTVFRNIR